MSKTSTLKRNYDTEYSIYKTTPLRYQKALDICIKSERKIYAAKTKKSQQNINLIQSNVKGTCGAVRNSLRECDFQNSMHSVAAVGARRVVHKYVDGYYSRLAALRKRSENFRTARI